MRKKKLNSQQLALLSLAFSKNLFPKPELNDLLVDENKFDDRSCMFYFEFAYYDKLLSAIKAKYQAGSFAESNSEIEWNDLMYAIESATTENDVDKNNCYPYGYDVKMDNDMKWEDLNP